MAKTVYLVLSVEPEQEDTINGYHLHSIHEEMAEAREHAMSLAEQYTKVRFTVAQIVTHFQATLVVKEA
jgi:hypothetical protein